MLNFLKAEQSVRDGATLEIIPIESVRPNPYQPRKNFSDDAIAELASSIRQYGIIQPINVRKTGTASYELIAGERRLRASKLAGMREIKAIVLHSMYDHDSALIAMIENLQRENLHFFEEAEGYQSLIREHGFTQDGLAVRLSKNQSTIANKLRILRLPRSIKEKIIDYSLSERHARALLRLHNETSQLILVKKIGEENLSVKITEELVEKELCRLYDDNSVPEFHLNVVKMRAGDTIYLNTIKNALRRINNMGGQTEFSSEADDGAINIRIRIFK